MADGKYIGPILRMGGPGLDKGEPKFTRWDQIQRCPEEKVGGMPHSHL